MKYLCFHLFIFTFRVLTPTQPSHPSRSSGALQAEPGPYCRRGEEAVHVAETQRQRGASPVSLQRPRSAAAHRQRGDLGVQQGMMEGLAWSWGSGAEATVGAAQQKHVDEANFSPPSSELCLLSGNSVYETVKVMESVQCAGPLSPTQQRFMGALISSSSRIRAAVKLSLSTFMIHSLKVEHLRLRVLMFLNDEQHC